MFEDAYSCDFSQAREDPDDFKYHILALRFLSGISKRYLACNASDVN